MWSIWAKFKGFKIYWGKGCIDTWICSNNWNSTQYHVTKIATVSVKADMKELLSLLHYCTSQCGQQSIVVETFDDTIFSLSLCMCYPTTATALTLFARNLDQYLYMYCLLKQFLSWYMHTNSFVFFLPIFFSSLDLGRDNRSSSRGWRLMWFTITVEYE